MAADEIGYGSILSVEQNSINVISESERKRKPRDLFWPWRAANILASERRDRPRV